MPEEKKDPSQERLDSIAKKLAKTGEEHKVDRFIGGIFDAVYSKARKGGSSGADFESVEITDANAKSIADDLTYTQREQYWCRTNGWTREKLAEFISKFGNDKDKVSGLKVMDLAMSASGMVPAEGIEKLVNELKGQPLNPAMLIQQSAKMSEGYQKALGSMVLKGVQPKTIQDIEALQKYTGSKSLDPEYLMGAFAQKAGEKYGRRAE